MSIFKKNTFAPATCQHYLFVIRDYLLAKKIPYDPATFTSVQERASGKVFTLRDHLKALVYAQMSAQTKWSNIVPQLKLVDKIFHNYDPEYIRSQPGNTSQARLCPFAAADAALTIK